MATLSGRVWSEKPQLTGHVATLGGEGCAVSCHVAGEKENQSNTQLNE